RHRGPGAWQDGQDPPRDPRAAPRRHRAAEPREAAHEAARDAAAGRHRGEGGLDSRGQRPAHLRAVQQAGSRRPPPPREGTVRAQLPPLQRPPGGRLTMAARLRERYRTEVAPALMRELGYTNVLAVPRLEKIVLNMGVGEAVQNPKVIESAVDELTAIAGQKPVVTRAKKAISNFKLREGMPIGAMVTLRGERMYEFLDRLVAAALPRVRDFKGIPDRSFDGRGNYSLGLREQVIFPEINLDKVDKIKGLTIVICTTARTDAEGKALLRGLGLPFRA